MLNICSVNVQLQNALADPRHVSWSYRAQFEENLLRKLRTIILPKYFMVFDFYHGI